jgi:hypothetical protein
MDKFVKVLTKKKNSVVEKAEVTAQRQLSLEKSKKK